MLNADAVAKRFRALAGGARGREPTSLVDIADLTEEVVVDGNLDEVTRLRLLLKRLDAVTNDPAVSGRLTGLDDVLASSERRRILAAHQTRLDSRREGVRDRVLEVVVSAGEPIQPSLVAQQCGIRLHQVSRALAELVERGLVARVTVQAEGDGRARWYQSSQPHRSGHEPGPRSPSLAAGRIQAGEPFEVEPPPRAHTAAPATVGYGSYRGRPIELPVELPGVDTARAFATVVLPLHLQWSRRSRRYDLSVRADRARMYSAVLREGTPGDIVEWIDPRLLIDLWDDLALPAPVKAAWRQHLASWGVER